MFIYQYHCAVGLNEGLASAADLSTHTSGNDGGLIHPSSCSWSTALFLLSCLLSSHVGRLVLPPLAWNGKPSQEESRAPCAIGRMSGTSATAGHVSGRSSPRGQTLIRASCERDTRILIQISPSLMVKRGLALYIEKEAKSRLIYDVSVGALFPTLHAICGLNYSEGLLLG